MMTKQQLQIVQHSLGVDQYGRGEQYRNFFCAGGKDEDVCRELIALGYMQQHPTSALSPYFNCSVTESGKAAMRAESPKPPRLTRGQQRYAEWLSMSDCCPDLSFGDYLKRARRAS